MHNFPLLIFHWRSRLLIAFPLDNAMRAVTLIFSAFLLSSCASIFVDQCVDKGESRDVCEAKQNALSKEEFGEQQKAYIKQLFNKIFVEKP